MNELNFKLSSFQAKVAIIGQGFVGLALAESISEAGYLVVGIEIDRKRLSQIAQGISPVETVTSGALRAMQEKSRYVISDDYERIRDSDVVILTVPTPLDSEGNPDLSSLVFACKSISPYVKENTLIVNESTSYPGTLREIVMPNILSDLADLNLYFACSPERVNPGDTRFGIKNTPRVVSGIGVKAQELVTQFYSSFVAEVQCVSNPETAEMSKLLENSYRLVNIAFINEVSDYCRIKGISAREVIEAASTKPFGFSAFYPSLGIGGHCIPIDPKYLLFDAGRTGSGLAILSTAAQSNRERISEVVDYLEKIVGTLKQKKVLIYGVSYKPGIADTRESASEQLFEQLQSKDSEVEWYDEVVSEWHRGKKADLQNGHFDVVIIAILSKSSNPKKIYSQFEGSKIIDFTGLLEDYDSVIQY